MDRSKNSFAPAVQDDRAARALILVASKKILELRRVHDEAATLGNCDEKERANAERAELKKIFEQLQSFEPDPEKPLTARSLENIDAARKEVEVTLINYETFADDSGVIPEDTELDDLIERLTTTNTVVGDDDKRDVANKTKDETDEHLTNRVNRSITDAKNDEKQNNISKEIETPNPAELTGPFTLNNDQTPTNTDNNGGKKGVRQHDDMSRGSRRSKGKTSSVASSKREVEKVKNDVKIRFMEEQVALEEKMQKMELEAEAVKESVRRQMEMQVESAKRRLKVETLKAEARRDDELARIEEEQDVTDDEFDEEEFEDRKDFKFIKF